MPVAPEASPHPCRPAGQQDWLLGVAAPSPAPSIDPLQLDGGGEITRERRLDCPPCLAPWVTLHGPPLLGGELCLLHPRGSTGDTTSQLPDVCEGDRVPSVLPTPSLSPPCAPCTSPSPPYSPLPALCQPRPPANSPLGQDPRLSTLAPARARRSGGSPRPATCLALGERADPGRQKPVLFSSQTSEPVPHLLDCPGCSALDLHVQTEGSHIELLADPCKTLPS